MINPERYIHSSCLPRPHPTSPAETEGLTTLTLPYLKDHQKLSEAIYSEGRFGTSINKLQVTQILCTSYRLNVNAVIVHILKQVRVYISVWDKCYSEMTNL